MRVLVCGGRGYTNKKRVFEVLDELDQTDYIDCVVNGGASGADSISTAWAEERYRELLVFRADWMRHGKAAGPLRNQRMIDEGDPSLVVAFAGGDGTADMVKRAKAAGIQVLEVTEDQGVVSE